MKSKKRKSIFLILFTIYMFLLVKVILFKYPRPMIREILKSSRLAALSFRIGHSNFIAFKSIFRFLFKSKNIRISIKNLLGNIIAFMPFGFLLPILSDRMKKIKSMLVASFILSLSFEVIQLVTGLGEFDVDDILLNILGGLLGYLLYSIFCSKFSEASR